MKTFSNVSLIAGGLLLAGVETAWADEFELATQYFGHIEAPCATAEQCKKFTDLVIRASRGNECNKIDEVCEVGEEILKSIFGSVYRQTLPDFIVYLDDSRSSDKDKPATYHLQKHPPLLMWQGRNTPHLMGARAIYVVVLAHHKLDIQAKVTSDSQYEPNPLIGMLGILKSPEIRTSEPKQLTETKDGEFVWRPLSGNEYEDNSVFDGKKMVAWLGVARVEVPENTISRITVSYGLPPKMNDTKNANGSNSDTSAQGKSSDVKTNNEKDKYTGNFLSETGHFSNSPESNAAVSFAMGTTFNSRNTSIASGGSNINLDGFMFAKFYLSRPYLYAAPHRTRYSPSLGLVIGTNINGTVFNEFVFGVSFGHLVGNLGVIAGVNSIAGTPNSNQGRKSRALLALEYTF
jgi:hypothetical protein